MKLASPRPDLSAHELVVRSKFRQVVKGLRDLLGARLVAYIASVKETRAVHQWADGAREPSEVTQRRLRLALQVARTIADEDGSEITQAWFQGLNPQLDDRSPARLLREGDIEEVGPQLLAAARAFRVGG
jgi:hypothetical protein